ncbi:hypothetical protein LIER_38943 [Lithospermum erythrorhizon]|uniref:Uncharacterized protein n=1 Tax=Lithospermum erythrorhizon TaxID=34254 RepID=A0AAV3Q946_LITER
MISIFVRPREVCSVIEGSQSVVFNAFPHSSFSSNDAITLDLATQAVLAKEKKTGNVAFEKAQVDSTNEFLEMFVNL